MPAASWTHDRHVDAAEAEIAAFAAALEGARWETPVPTTPDWSLGDLARHVGVIHRWAEALVRTGAQERRSPRGLGVAVPEAPEELPSWLVEGGELLVKTLREHDPAEPVWGWGPDHHVRFWSRRMVHETLVHRCDAELALGRDPVIDAAVAEDGVAELLTNLPSAAAFAPKVGELRGEGTALAFVAPDAGARWVVRLRPDGFDWTSEDAGAAGTGGGAGTETGAAVSGDAADLYLFLWGRRKLGDPRLEFSGDEVLLVHWVEHSGF
ncbi:maleylpyruvate isomerase family mycothiol-dependent enzyme [Actinomadura rugatobispora]|uniref:Maleylpyruvate isomerase family mycothiol-dependent enzyme n=1 Tax=Actinomadura rugatobispora TaxID=1994 RepID=A0ABW1AHD1_9ACTN|nr:maleylpyruvate isomerase family mycothiol-dependent enzyme [Actinomadura rugatobispora]